LIKLLKSFSQDFDGAFEELKGYIEREDFDGASQLLHTLRGVSGNLAAIDLQKISMDLEEATKTQDHQKIRGVLPDFKNALEVVLSTADSINDKMPSTPKIKEPDPDFNFIMFEGSVLIADDNMANRMVAEALVGRHGLRVMSVEDGQAALELMEREGFDLVLLDGHMPRLDGPATLAEIRKREAGVWVGRHHVVVALTGFTATGDRKRLLELGFDDYLPKPLEEVALQDVLKRVLTATDEVNQVPKSKGSQWDAMAQAMGGREGLLEFLAVFMQDSDDRQARIHKALEAGERYKLSREAHDLKSNAAILGFDELSELSKGIEKDAMALSEPELYERLDWMDKYLEEARIACRKYLENDDYLIVDLNDN